MNEPHTADIDIRDLLRRAPVFHGLDLSALDIEPLGSSANLVYKIGCGDDAYALRLPGRERFISPFSEHLNQSSASTLGLAPQCLWYDEVTGSLLTRWLPNARPVNRMDMEDPIRRRLLCRTLARIHYGTQPFRDSIAPVGALSWNLRGAAGQDRRLQELSAPARELIRGMAPALANCHGDPVCENILLLEPPPGEFQLVDWEYSHRTTPYWDLAILCNCIDADSKCVDNLIDDYNRCCSEYGVGRLGPSELTLFRGVSALISAAWIINHAEPGMDAESMIQVAQNFLEA